MQKVIETHLGRKFTVLDELAIGTGSVIVEVVALNNGKEIASRLVKDDAIDLGEAVLKAAGKKVFTYEGSLPGVGIDGNYYVSGQGSNSVARAATSTSEDVMIQIKALIAIHNKIVKEEEYRKTEEFKEAEALRVLNERRDALVNLWCDTSTRSYATATHILRNAVDDHIKLQDELAAKNNPPLAQWEIDLLEGK